MNNGEKRGTRRGVGKEFREHYLFFVSVKLGLVGVYIKRNGFSLYENWV